ncbi:SPFH domain-containing protein [Pseudonocardia sp. RS010]|uniref:SPFH domain-containing protein n=1 Tax=Pseudonocardia sp. RS010 TaxID=3385979 RepID=UPI0039A02CFB
MTVLWVVLLIVGLTVLVGGLSCVRVVQQFERGVVFRFGRLQPQTRGPGLAVLMPLSDRMHKVSLQVVTLPIPAQDGITSDNVTVRVDAVVYYRVVDPVRVSVDVQDYGSAILQVAQASLRSIIGKSELDDLLSNRERLNQGLELMIDNPAVGWGVHIDRVEIKDVVLPESMKRSMSRQAEAERERRSRVITAEGELQASKQLAEAAEVMTSHPAALQLRLLQTVVEVAAEKNSTLVLPFPVELLRFLERSTPSARPSAAQNGDRPPAGDAERGDAGEVGARQAVARGDDEQRRTLHPPVHDEPHRRDDGERDRPAEPRLAADGGEHDEGDQHERGDHPLTLPGAR